MGRGRPSKRVNPKMLSINIDGPVKKIIDEMRGANDEDKETLSYADFFKIIFTEEKEEFEERIEKEKLRRRIKELEKEKKELQERIEKLENKNDLDLTSIDDKLKRFLETSYDEYNEQGFITKKTIDFHIENAVNISTRREYCNLLADYIERIEGERPDQIEIKQKIRGTRRQPRKIKTIETGDY